jgi:hypothetical protein
MIKICAWLILIPKDLGAMEIITSPLNPARFHPAKARQDYPAKLAGPARAQLPELQLVSTPAAPLLELKPGVGSERTYRRYATLVASEAVLLYLLRPSEESPKMVCAGAYTIFRVSSIA